MSSLSSVLLISSLLLTIVQASRWNSKNIIKDISGTITSLQHVTDLCVLGPDDDFQIKELSDNLRTNLQNLIAAKTEAVSGEKLMSNKIYLRKLSRILDDMKETNYGLLNRWLTWQENTSATAMFQFKAKDNQGRDQIIYETNQFGADFVIATRNLNGYLERLIRKIQWRQTARPNGRPVLWQVVSTERFLESMTRTMEKLHIVISLCVLSLGDNLTTKDITEKLKSNAQSFGDVREEVLTNARVLSDRHFLGTLREIIQEVDSISKRLLFQWINAPDSKMQFGRKTEYKIDFHADSGTLKSIVSNDPFRAEFITETNDLRKNLMSLLSVIHPGLPVKPNGRPYLGTTSGTV